MKNPATANFLQRTLFGPIKDQIFDKKSQVSKLKLEIDKKSLRIDTIEDEITSLENDLEQIIALIEDFGGVVIPVKSALEEAAEKLPQPVLVDETEDMF